MSQPVRRRQVVFGLAGLLAARAQAAPQPARAVAWSADGSRLAVGKGDSVELLDWPGGGLVRRIEGPQQITSLAWSPDGRRLAVAGGEPGRRGSLLILETASGEHREWAGPHEDVIYAVAWSPSGDLLASGGYDRLVVVRELAAARARVLKEHTDSVWSLDLAGSGPSLLLASGSADRTVKLWDPLSGRRLYTLSSSTAEVYAVRFLTSAGWAAGGAAAQLVSAGADRVIRLYDLDAQRGRQVRSSYAHEAPVIQLDSAASAGRLASAGEDGAVRLWSLPDLTPGASLPQDAAPPLALDMSRDGRWIAVGRLDGSTAVYRCDSPASAAWEGK